MSEQLSNDLLSLKIDRGTKPERRSGRPLVLVVGVAAVLGVSAVGYSVAAPYIEAKFFRTKVDVTEVSLVSPSQATIELSATGYVVPQVTAEVGAKVIGRVAKNYIKEGSHVKAGDPLFDLDVSDQRSAIASAQARYTATVAKARASRAQIREVQQQLVREKKLVATGAVAPANAQDLEARVAALTATAASMDADAVAAKAEVQRLSVELGNYKVVAPIDGTVVNKPVQVGTTLNFELKLVEIVDFDSLLIEADVPEGKLNTVKKDGPCEVVLDAFPSKRIRATVVEVSPKLNRAKATGTVKVKLIDAAEGVLPEMSARVSFLTKALDENQLKEPPRKIVPSSAVADRGGTKVVFALEGEKVRQQRVELGAPFANGFELKSGPEPGTTLVKDPLPTLSDGQEIKRN